MIKYMRKILLIFTLLFVAVLAGCSSVPELPEVDGTQNGENVDNSSDESSFEDEVSEGLVEDDNSQEIGSLI